MSQPSVNLQTNRRADVTAYVIAAAFFSLRASCEPSGSSPPTERSIFSAEDEMVRNPASIPAGVLAIIAKDPDIEGLLRTHGISQGSIPANWLLASEVHLDGPHEKNLVVIGSGPILGANVTTFWLFRPKKQGFGLILTAVGHDLAIKRTRSYSYRDIEVSAATAVAASTILYRFENGRYRATRRRNTTLR